MAECRPTTLTFDGLRADAGSILATVPAVDGRGDGVCGPWRLRGSGSSADMAEILACMRGALPAR